MPQLPTTETQTCQIMALLEAELKNIYWTEQALIQTLPKMIRDASSQHLTIALENHLKETRNHVVRLEEVFESLQKESQSVPDDSMSEMLENAELFISGTEKGALRDAGIISFCQKIEHYEMATYTTLRQFADALEMEDVATLLETTLNEEKMADITLTRIAVSYINPEVCR